MLMLKRNSFKLPEAAKLLLALLLTLPVSIWAQAPLSSYKYYGVVATTGELSMMVYVTPKDDTTYSMIFQNPNDTIQHMERARLSLTKEQVIELLNVIDQSKPDKYLTISTKLKSGIVVRCYKGGDLLLAIEMPNNESVKLYRHNVFSLTNSLWWHLYKRRWK